MPQLSLLVHLIFHPDSSNARKLAQAIHIELNDDPSVPSLNIPTVFCIEDGIPTVSTQDFHQADKNLIILIADEYIDTGKDWCNFAGDLWESCQHTSNRFIPFQLSEGAWPLDERMKEVNFIRAYNGKDTQYNIIIRRILIELCRYLHGDIDENTDPKAPVKLFISHTKHDVETKPKIAKKISKALDNEQPIEVWYDTGDIPAGSYFTEEIKKGIEDSALLCVLTNNYASREWCRREILLAKEYQRPITIVNGLTDKEVRSFPYIGNLPVIRWNNNVHEVINLVLKDALRHLHNEGVLNQLKAPDDIVFSRTPELLTLLDIPNDKNVLYPDPPLGAEEIKILNKTGKTVTTPLERLSKKKTLQGTKIALSMSESTDIHKFGFDQLHLEAAILEVSRYLLVKGTTLVYGGHLGSDGYTEHLIELVRSHNMIEGVEPFNRCENYIGWPLPYGKATESKYKRVCKLIRIERPDDIDESMSKAFTSSPVFSDVKATLCVENRYAWSRGMTAMREAQTKKCSARIIVGGTFGATIKVNPDGSKQSSWYSSLMPGTLEEMLISLKYEQPIFLIGAFGGVAKMIIDILEGKTREEMSWDYQKGAPFSEELHAMYKERGDEWVNYDEMVKLIQSKGIQGLNNGLSEDENHRLFRTKNTQEIVALVMKGMDSLKT